MTLYYLIFLFGQDLVELGAKTLLVPGNFPIGCVPAYLDVFESNDAKKYDSETGCIRWLNEFSEYHNRLLLEELERLRKRHPHVTIIYADYYGATISFFHAPKLFGVYSLLRCTSNIYAIFFFCKSLY